MAEAFDVLAIGNAIVDVIAPADDAFLDVQGLARGSMTLIDEARGAAIYQAMAKGVETSGGSAANTVVGVASFGGSAAYIGKVASDALGETFIQDIGRAGVRFTTPPLEGGPGTARCLVNVTADGQRTMATFLGASTEIGPEDVDPHLIAGASLIYLEGYLFDAQGARAAFARAAGLARDAGRRLALSLSDIFVAERHRAGLLAFMQSDVDVVFANEAEVLSLFETSDLASALDALAGRVAVAAVTRGAEGSVIVSGAARTLLPAQPVERVVDTTGAGDQYAAGFLYGLARGQPLEACGRLGHIAAAEVISHYGPRPETPLRALAASQHRLQE